ncbi:MAG: hypothetical protein C0418_00440, partial [Coriobacteriaceae bacterium]|nr:hypothetical protein [Coriobacteriaceae bacterium]
EALTDGTVTDPETSRRYLRIIRDESGRLGDLTRVLLSLADLDAGVVEFDRGPVDAEALADSVRARFEPRAAERSVRFEVGALDAAVPLGDAARLLQAASAVVDNALEYTPPGGEVLVSARAEPGCWILTVDDSGPGIPPGDREAVFERFTRLDRSRSTTGGGSGLGLSLSRRLVRLMDGDVRAEDSPLGGARIVLELPAQAQAQR